MANRSSRDVKSNRAVRIVLRTPISLAIAAGLYFVVYRPLQLGWGATSGELARSMPGDSIQADPAFNATRAVSINAPPEAIWPWLVQIGYKRAGWYSALDWADNGGVPSAERIVPALQGLKVGDTIPVTGRGDPLSFVPDINWRVVELRPNHHLLATSEVRPGLLALVAGALRGRADQAHLADAQRPL